MPVDTLHIGIINWSFIMKEKYFAYKISINSSGLVCTQQEFEEDKMLDLLKELVIVQDSRIYWIFRQFNNEPQEAFCIIDCEHKRVYYHHSGEVEDVESIIHKLSRQ